jgi:hypothetical protein
MSRLIASARHQTTKDIALTAMLVLQCTALFIGAPLAALEYKPAFLMVDFLVLPFALLVIVIARGRAAAFIAIVGAVLVLFAVVTHGLDLPQATGLTSVAGLLGISICCVVIGMAVAAPGVVTIHRLLGAVVLYLSTALAFGHLYRLIWQRIPEAFAGMPANAAARQAFAALVYFSFTTLTSTGYGDITPVHPLVRSVANFEGVIGQLFPATLIAALLTQHLETRRGRHG